MKPAKEEHLSLTNDLRVLSVIQAFRPAFSGEGEWWLRMIPLLAKRGVRVEILTSGNGGGKRHPEPEVIEGVRVHRIQDVNDEISYRAWVGRMQTMMRAIRERQKYFDVILFHSPNCDAVYASCLLGRLFGWKTVFKMTLFGSDDLSSIRNSGKLGTIRQELLRLADGYISISEALTRTFDEAGFDRAKLATIAQGVDMAKYRPVNYERKSSIRRELGISERARVALFCGSIMYRKGVDILIEAWRQVSAQLDNVVLLLVGPDVRGGLVDAADQRFAELIAERIRDWGLESNTRLLGYQSAMDKFYAAADLFVFPSRAEGWGNVITEAMASGLPCIVSWLDGIAQEQLGEDGGGVIIRSEDPSEYAAHIIRTFTEEGTAKRMGEQARTRAVKRFDLERAVENYAAFLREICGKPLLQRSINPASEALRKAG